MPFRRSSFGRVYIEVILCEVEHNHFQFAIHSCWFFGVFFFLIERDSEEKAASSDTAPSFSRGSDLGIKRAEEKHGRILAVSEDAKSNLSEIICESFNPS